MENLYKYSDYLTKISIVKFYSYIGFDLSSGKIYPRRNYRVIYRWKLNGTTDQKTTSERSNRNKSFCINCLYFLRKHLIAQLFSSEIKDLQKIRMFIKKMSRDAVPRFKILQMTIIAILSMLDLSPNTKEKLPRYSNKIWKFHFNNINLCAP